MSYRRTETQKSIATWAAEAFGEAGSHARVIGRANEEMAELIRAVTAGADARELVYEAADVVIILYRLAERCGADLDFVIDRKMAINRERTWVPDGTGHGYHVRNKEAPKS